MPILCDGVLGAMLFPCFLRLSLIIVNMHVLHVRIADGFNRISCAEGITNTTQYAVPYTVERRAVGEYGCQFEEYSLMWPDRPRNLSANQQGPNISIAWSPPNDGSVQALTGFLVQVYDHSPHVFNFHPEVCYSVTLTSPLVNEQSDTSHDIHRPLVQDAMFSLHCHVQGTVETIYAVFVTSLPMPKATIMMDAELEIHYKAYTPPTHKQESGPSDDEVHEYTHTPRGSATRTDDMVKAAALGGSCVFLVVINIVIIHMVCRSKRRRVAELSTHEASQAVKRLVDHQQDRTSQCV